jgi:hypothetical protein
MNKKAMSLLEIMLAIGLLAMIGGLLAFKAKDLFETYGFRQDVSKFLTRIELAKKYALSYQSDVEFLFYEKQGQFFCELRSDEPALQKHKLFFNSIRFKSIKSVTFSGKKKEEFNTLLFSGTGWMFPTTSLEIHSKTKKETVALVPIGACFN